MAKPQFNRNLFGAKRQERAQSDFPEVSSGTYICDVKKAYLGEAKASGRLQAVFGYQIVDDSPDYPNQYIWEYIGLSDADGNDQQGGYDALAIKLSQLKAPDSGDIESDLEAILDSRVRLEYTAGDENAAKDDKKFYAKFRIKRLISRPDGSPAVEGYKAANTQSPEELDSTDPGVELTEGMIVILLTGEERVIVEMVEKEESGDGGEYLMVMPQGGKMSQMTKISINDIKDVKRPEPQTGKVTEERPSQSQQQPAKTDKPVSAALGKAQNVTTVTPTADELDGDSDLDAPIAEDGDESVIVEEDDEPVITVGAKVTATTVKGKNIVGKVFALADANGLITVDWPNDKGQTVRSQCKSETVKLAD